MIPTFATRTQVSPPGSAVPFAELGNCWEACLATITTGDLGDVPERTGDSGSPPGAELADQLAWLADRGDRLMWLPATAPPIGLAIATVLTAGGHPHSVVTRDGELVHDPNPTGPLELVGVFEYAALVPIAAAMVAVLVAEPPIPALPADHPAREAWS